MKPPSAQAVRDANKRLFESKRFDDYEKNPSIFEPSRQAEIASTLAARAGRRVLDIGCGTGNILRLAKPAFRECWGLDLSGSLLRELARRVGDLRLQRADAGRLPYRSGSFDLVSCYGVLHHILDARGTLAEAHRVLRPGGALYLDHDPNWFFGRFYHVFYRLRYADRPGFGSWEAEIAEWHHTRTGGLNPERLESIMRRLGFRDVEIRYRITTNPDLPAAYRAARAVMRAVTRLYPFKSLHTHFTILATK